MTGGIPHPLEVLFGGGSALSCGSAGELRAELLHGFFAGDTRLLSTYRFTVAGHSWRLLARSRVGPSSAQWDMQNPTVRAPGGDLEEGTLHCRLHRQVSGALRDELVVSGFVDRPISLRLTLQLDADFSDVFQVKDGSTPPRLDVQRAFRPAGVSFLYQRGGFRRALHVTLEASPSRLTFVGTQAVFDVILAPGRPWRCRMEAVPELDGARLEFRAPGRPAAPPAPATGLTIDAAPILKAPFEQGRVDLDLLTMQGTDGQPFIAAGAPWFMALFGRDTLVTSLMAGLLGPRYVEGSLAALASLQARARDDYRDAQPGKIAHELRRGELAWQKLVPHTPYYGTHDAPALFVLTLWHAYRWTGRRELLTRYLDAAKAALRWCSELGDEDGDGLLEYRTVSPKGYRNQGWKDAADAIPHEDGPHADLPIATVELQGYWFAARLAMAELLDAMGDVEAARSLRADARRLQRLVEERFWMEDAGCYALALDGRKRLVRSLASNPGQLLWCGLPSGPRARLVADRLLDADMFSGYGVRTLTARHRRYNPLSYQLGSVWPHDNALIAAGLARYGLREQAAQVLAGILQAAGAFDQHRLPELFCGFARDEGPPVPYEKANVPQAWAAAAPILATQIFLGLLPDVPNGRCYLSPFLPDWLPALELRGIQVGDGPLEVRLHRAGKDTQVAAAHHPTLQIIVGAPPAPLWGAPPE